MTDSEGKIAIVSTEGRFPGGADVEALWTASLEGRSLLSRFTLDDLESDGISQREASRERYVPVKGALDEPLRFDAERFGYSPAEATAIDPQQRIFLECCAAALDRGACDPRRFAGRIAVFAGQFISTYLLNRIVPASEAVERLGLATVFQGNTVDQLAARVAYKLGLTGPAVTVQTACSTSLVAAHLACQALLRFECDAALAGGVMITLPNRAGYVAAEGGIWSPSGVCRPFDAAADGTVFSDGAAVVFLKRLEDALADGDSIRAIILGSAINNDGHDKAGYSAPSLTGQVGVLAETLEISGASPESVRYVETHGTGTKIGDPIEVQALQAVYGRSPETIYLGALKANIGHLDAAAGVAGLIRASLAVESGQIPPLAGFSLANPLLALDQGPFKVPTTALDWPGGGPRRAAVSAFGVGGTNAHIIVEAPPAALPPAEPADAGERLIPLSSHSAAGLQALKSVLLEAGVQDLPLAEVQATLALGRPEFAWRDAVVATDGPSFAAGLRRAGPPAVRARARGAIFVLPGQGVPMDYAEDTPTLLGEPFALHFNQASDALRAAGAMNPSRIFGSGAAPLETELVQPAGFAMGYALVRCFVDHGLAPSGFIGHSVGELVAATAAGVLSLEDAATVVAHRARLMQSAPQGAMIALPLSASEAGDLLEAGISLAADNAPASTVLSGPEPLIARVEAKARARGLEPLRLAATRAFHSAMMDEILEPLKAALMRIELRDPAIPIYSTLLGRRVQPGEMSEREYWLRQIREPVRFRDAVASVEWPAVFVDIALGRPLSGPLRACLAGHEEHEVSPGVRAEAGSPTRSDILRAVGRAWRAGAALDWSRITSPAARRLHLPPNPLAGEVHDIASGSRPSAELFKQTAHEPQLYGVHYLASHQPVAKETVSERRRRWLLIADTFEELDPFRVYLEAHGQVVSTVVPGHSFERVSRGRYRAPLDTAEGVAELFRELRAHVRAPNVILQAPPEPQRSRAARLGPLLFTAQATHFEGGANRVRFAVLTKAALRALADDPVEPIAAEVLGPVIVVPQETPCVTTRLIDVADLRELNEKDLAAIVERILGDDDELAALRGGSFLTSELRPLTSRAGRVTRPGGHYLITGGLGGLGAALARKWAEEGAVITLVSRRGDPLAQPDAQVGGDQIVSLKADVCDRDALLAALKEAVQRQGPICGVVHAAGVPGGRPSIVDDLVSASAVFAPKVAGAESLAWAISRLPDGPPAFVALISSVASTVGGPGQWAYAGASAYLDALAMHRHGTDAPRWVSVGLDTIGGVGMAAAIPPSSLERLRESFGHRSLTVAQAIEAIEAAVSAPVPHLLVSSFSPEQAARVRRALADGVTYAVGAKQERPELTTTFAPPSTDAEEIIAGIWADALGLTRIGVNDSFIDLGGHSLIAAQTIGTLRERFDLELPVSVLFEHLTVAELAREIERMIVSELSEAAPARTPERLEEAR